MTVFKSTALMALTFIGACSVTYFVIQSRRSPQPIVARNDTISGVRGLDEGEVVSLPELSSLSGQTVALSKLEKKDRVLCSFLSAACAGCALDADFWRQLYEQSQKTDVAFYLVDVGDDRQALEHFVGLNKLDTLPVLFDPTNRVGPNLKIGLVPQYLLFSKQGKVLHRWDGIRQNDHRGEQEKIAEFFSAYH